MAKTSTIAAWRNAFSRHDAFAIYAAMSDNERSIKLLRVRLKEKYGCTAPWQRLHAWSVSDKWGDRLAQMEIKVYDGIADQIARGMVDATAARIKMAREIHDQALTLLLDRLKATTDYYERLGRGDTRKGEQPPIDISTATGAKAFQELAMLAERHVNTLEGKIAPDGSEVDRSSDHGSLLGRFAPTLAEMTRPI